MRSRWFWGLAPLILGVAGAAYAAPLSVAGGRVSAPELNSSQGPDVDVEEEDERDDPRNRGTRNGEFQVRAASLQESTADEPMSPQVMDDPVTPVTEEAGGCQSGGCGQCQQCCAAKPLSGIYGRAEYLYWFVRGQETPPLVTTSPANTPQAAAGLLPGSNVLYGGSPINGQGRSGGRFTLGYWLDPNETFGIESTTLVLQTTNTSYNSGLSTGLPILARPFSNAATGSPDANLIAFPGLVVGNIGTAATTKAFGTEINFRRMMAANNNRRTDMLIGYRFFRFDEGLEVATTSASVATAGVVPVGTTFNIHDTFGTQNQFNGLNLGLRSEWFFNRWSLDVLGKAAIGGMTETVAIQGNTVTRVPGFAPFSAAGGILTQPQTFSGVGVGGNIGTYRRTQVAGIPEFNTNLHFQIAPNLRFNVGYSLLYLTNAVRPGNQIDTIVDPNRFPPGQTPVSQHPLFSYSERAVWMQGVNLGLEARF